MFNTPSQMASPPHHVTYQPRAFTGLGTMFIDAETTKNLELVTNSLSHKSSNTLFGTRSSLSR